jgi:uncharacterized membrane protein YfcA
VGEIIPGIPTDLLVASLIVFLASAAQAVTGFGFALVLVPLLAFVYEPKLVVIVSISLGILCKVPLLVPCWREVQWRRIAPLTLTAIVGTYFGTQLLVLLDADVLRLSIGCLVVLLASPMLFDFRRPVVREGLAALGVGFTSGVLGGATSMGGPPVVLLGVNQAWRKESFRANLLAFFVVSNTSSLLNLARAGALTGGMVALDAALIPATALGIVAGNWLFKRIAPERFRKLVVVFVIATGLLSIWTGARALIG